MSRPIKIPNRRCHWKIASIWLVMVSLKTNDGQSIHAQHVCFLLDSVSNWRGFIKIRRDFNLSDRKGLRTGPSALIFTMIFSYDVEFLLTQNNQWECATCTTMLLKNVIRFDSVRGLTRFRSIVVIIYRTACIWISLLGLNRRWHQSDASRPFPTVHFRSLKMSFYLFLKDCICIEPKSFIRYQSRLIFDIHDVFSHINHSNHREFVMTMFNQNGLSRHDMDNFGIHMESYIDYMN